ncbi:MAG: hypothetical protein DCC71_01445 [Proteobacteria bacterium]|nr:MAG: hypothetical protein DCC71_01445 [Pseudomonadota bacterium]
MSGRARLGSLALALASLAISLAAVELGLRAGIRLGVPALRDPDLYADASTDDDWWKLHHRWGGRFELPSARQVDPLLGWSLPRTPSNPLGVLRDEPYRVDPRAPAILFYGDSFVRGMTPMPERIPQRLEARLGGPAVYNYGIGGYGLDQIYLRFRASHASFERPFVLFGVMTDDIDRCVLRVRSGPKPYFELDGDALVLRGTPVDPDPRAWLERNPPSIASYFGALVTRKLRLLRAAGRPSESAYGQERKRRLADRLLEAVVREARDRDLPLLFVFFYPRYELDFVGWRERFLREAAARLAVETLDTKQVLLAEASRRGVPAHSFYEGGHPNALGNDLVAAALAERLRARQGAERSQSAP